MHVIQVIEQLFIFVLVYDLTWLSGHFIPYYSITKSTWPHRKYFDRSNIVRNVLCICYRIRLTDFICFLCNRIYLDLTWVFCVFAMACISNMFPNNDTGMSTIHFQCIHVDRIMRTSLSFYYTKFIYTCKSTIAWSIILVILNYYEAYSWKVENGM